MTKGAARKLESSIPKPAKDPTWNRAWTRWPPPSRARRRGSRRCASASRSWWRPGTRCASRMTSRSLSQGGSVAPNAAAARRRRGAGGRRPRPWPRRWRGCRPGMAAVERRSARREPRRTRRRGRGGAGASHGSENILHTPDDRLEEDSGGDTADTSGSGPSSDPRAASKRETPAAPSRRKRVGRRRRRRAARAPSRAMPIWYSARNSLPRLRGEPCVTKRRGSGSRSGRGRR